MESTKNSRRDFLRISGLLSASTLLPFQKSFSKVQEVLSTNGSCVLIPTETAGPFPLDLTENTTYLRSDLRETKTGVPFKVKMKILGLENCEPMQNVRVNIWHCDKDGLYSGYDESNNAGQKGLTYLRGYQFTDANGMVEFTTIFPGWYTGRICHIHFQVYVSSSYAAISQMTFDIDKKNALYAANSSLYTKGSDPMTYSSDNIFSDGYQYQLATLEEDSSIGGYQTYLEVTVQGSGSVGIGHLEKQAAKNFTLGQNYPNPYSDQTTIPFELISKSDVVLTLYSFDGKKVHSQNLKDLSTGSHEIILKPKELGLASENYVYQLSVTNDQGTYTLNKVMTASK
ncbi:MAG: T9SS type A sorting domain-containing protein [Bacteroidetes bacterium]|nr:T9SS type A sorting domain-containing protein [Bacteroidota bacterium]